MASDFSGDLRGVSEQPDEPSFELVARLDDLRDSEFQVLRGIEVRVGKTRVEFSEIQPDTEVRVVRSQQPRTAIAATRVLARSGALPDGLLPEEKVKASMADFDRRLSAHERKLTRSLFGKDNYGLGVSEIRWGDSQVELTTVACWQSERVTAIEMLRDWGVCDAIASCGFTAVRGVTSVEVPRLGVGFDYCGFMVCEDQAGPVAFLRVAAKPADAPITPEASRRQISFSFESSVIDIDFNNPRGVLASVHDRALTTQVGHQALKGDGVEARPYCLARTSDRLADALISVIAVEQDVAQMLQGLQDSRVESPAFGWLAVPLNSNALQTLFGEAKRASQLHVAMRESLDLRDLGVLMSDSMRGAVWPDLSPEAAAALVSLARLYNVEGANELFGYL